MSDYLYKTISSQLRAAIVSGAFASEDMLPSENQLAGAYGTSRVTIRKALGVLENEGLVRPLHGKGYFVEKPRHTVFSLDFTELRPGDDFRYTKITILRPPDEVRGALALHEDAYTVLARGIVTRINSAGDAETVACDEKFIPYERGVPIIEREINYAEFADMFAERFPPVSIWVQLSISAAPVPREAARALGCDEGQRLLVARRLIRSREDRRVGYSRRWYADGCGALEASSGYFVTGRL